MRAASPVSCRFVSQLSHKSIVPFNLKSDQRQSSCKSQAPQRTSSEIQAIQGLEST